MSRVRGALRREIAKRDKGICRHCGLKASSAEVNKRGEIVFKDNEGKIYHIDHVIPVAEGGESTIENLVLSCANCNLSMRRKLIVKDPEVKKILDDINGSGS